MVAIFNLGPIIDSTFVDKYDHARIEKVVKRLAKDGMVEVIYNRITITFLNHMDIVFYWIITFKGIAAFFATIIVFYIIQRVAIARISAISKKTKNDLDDLAVALLEGIRPLFVLGLAMLIGASVNGVALDEITWLTAVIVLLITYQLVRWVGTLFDYVINKIDGVESAASLQGLKTVIHIIVWIGGIVFLLGVLGYNITSIVAGLGIGGIAVALAIQNILGDILSAFSLYFDKPFKVGDYIVAGDEDGIVERIGLKTTRLRSLDGQQVVLSNRQLTESTVQNYGNLQERRVVAHIGIDYATPNKKIVALATAIEDTVAGIDSVTFDRFHFQSFGDSALMCELVYYVASDDYDIFVVAQHNVNLALKALFEKKRIDIPYNTLTLIQKK